MRFARTVLLVAMCSPNVCRLSAVASAATSGPSTRSAIRTLVPAAEAGGLKYVIDTPLLRVTLTSGVRSVEVGCLQSTQTPTPLLSLAIRHLSPSGTTVQASGASNGCTITATGPGKVVIGRVGRDPSTGVVVDTAKIETDVDHLLGTAISFSDSLGDFRINSHTEDPRRRDAEHGGALGGRVQSVLEDGFKGVKFVGSKEALAELAKMTDRDILLAAIGVLSRPDDALPLHPALRRAFKEVAPYFLGATPDVIKIDRQGRELYCFGGKEFPVGEYSRWVFRGWIYSEDGVLICTVHRRLFSAETVDGMAKEMAGLFSFEHVEVR